ncbi:POM152 [[Candida] subhashii]|uniref:POM152 n=1 Tax=[Candida] subhashii TaxID=561895 RepID=A0A8J5QI54_9ASCO|nr:POM152 [[Candida] subhashii]KAG7663432.1 POM152 [[Candida] subhashii]
MSRPNGRDIYIREKEDGPLIPTTILDQASQRLFITSLFILIQSWKIYDLVLLKTEIPGSDEQLTQLNNFSYMLKYAIIDGLFLWLLPVLNIQYLTFSAFKTLLYTIILNVISLLLISSFALPLLSNIFVPIWKIVLQKKELNIIGEAVDRNSVIDMNAHFKGQLTIHYLPHSSAKMNPFHLDQTCINKEEPEGLSMPVEFNTTTGIGFLQIQQITPDNEIKLLNYTGHSLNKLMNRDYSHLSQFPEFKSGDSRVFYLEYPIIEPGMYRIKHVLDNKGNNIRTYKSEFSVSYCPQAKYLYGSSFDMSQNFKCISSLIDDTLPVPKIETSSTTPSYVQVNVKVNGRDFRTMNITVSDETDSTRKHQKFDYSWLKATKLVRNTLEQEILSSLSSLKYEGTTSVELQLLQIQDSLGNIQRYNPLSKDQDVWYSLNLKKSPSVGLVDAEKGAELLVGGHKRLLFTNIDSLKVEDFPLSVVIGFKNQHQASLNISNTFKTKHDFQKGLSVDQPGEYSLISAQTKFCPCETRPGTIQVKLATPPQVHIIDEAVSDRCLGTIGYNFNFNFTGKPPFKVQYRVYVNQSGVLRPVHSEQGRVLRELTSFENSHLFKFKPHTEGSYTIVFNNLKDLNYNQEPIRLDEKKHTYSTYFKQASEIGLKSTQKTIYTCYGQTSNIPLFFKGSGGPFKFDYDFIDPDSQKKLIDTSHAENVDSFSIDTPKGLIGKTYELRLTNAKDRFGCDAKITHPSIRIASRPDIPTLELSADIKDHIHVVEGDSVELPIVYKSSVGLSNNDKIEVKFTKPGSGDSRIMKMNVKGGSIRVSETGTYSLVSFENKGCPGRITHNERAVRISYFDKPSLQIVAENEFKQHKEENTIHLKPVCNGCSNKVKLQLTGKAPFILDYEIRLPSGKIETHSMNVEGHEIIISLPSRENGRYEHKFKRIYDGLYTKSRGRAVNVVAPRVLYNVNGLPNAKFINEQRFSQICENALGKSDKVISIPVHLDGQYPFDIDASLKNEKTGEVKNIQFKNVNRPNLEFSNSKLFGLGDYSISFTKISDGNGCTRKEFKLNDKYVISITETPDIFKAEPKKYHYCVGEHVAYNLTGFAPFTIFYSFNNRVRQTESFYRFERLSSKPGILEIQSLKDSGASECMVNFTSDEKKMTSLRLQVHELPTVEINKGDYIVEDLQEGDQTEIIFTFIGEPPFTLTYIRTIDIKQGKKTSRKLVEKHTLQDIWDYEVIVPASLEGTYEAIEIEDKYCRAIKKVDYLE